MNILVTGGRGMLGSAVARHLLQRGDNVTTFQRSPSGIPDRGLGPSAGRATEKLGDVADADDVAAAFRTADPAAVVHLAARVSVTGTAEDFVRTNVQGTGNVIAAARAAGARVVQVSSPSVAHIGRSIVGRGADPADPEHARGWYARTKALAEQLALGATGVDVVAVRPHIVWGPGDTQLVGRIVERAKSGRLALVGPGYSLIDTTYVDNAVDAIAAALDRAGDLRGRAFVVSNGQPRPVAELVRRICTAAAVPPPRVHVPFRLAYAAGAGAEAVWAALHRQDDPPMTRFIAEQLSTAHWFDLSQTRAALDWKPAVSLDEGFERLAAWYAPD
jgi:2-alkyl-3-oxoalkanoate reductase